MNFSFRIILVTLCLALCNKVLADESASSKVEGYHVLKNIKLGGDGSWDYLTIDSKARRLYIGRSNRVTVVDVDAEKVVGEIPDLEGVHGVTLVPALDKGFITCGKENAVRIFALTTLKISGKVPTGKTPDASLYDPASKRVFVFNHGETSTTVIDPSTEKVIGTVEIGGEPESGVADGKGKVYVNLENKSEIAVIDARSLKLISTCRLHRVKNQPV